MLQPIDLTERSTKKKKIDLTLEMNPHASLDSGVYIIYAPGGNNEKLTVVIKTDWTCNDMQLPVDSG